MRCATLCLRFVCACLAAGIIPVYQSPALAETPNVFVEPSNLILNQTVEVPAGKLVSVPVRLTKDHTAVAVTNVSGGIDDQIEAWLMEDEEYKKFSQNKRSFHLGKAMLKGDATFTYMVPKTGQHHIVLDNREATIFRRTVQLYVYSVLPSQPESALELAQKLQQGFYDPVMQVFQSPAFRVFVHRCGMTNAFSNPDIHICTELLESPSRETFGFVLYHELAHTLLDLWEYPLAGNEDVADEFATVAMMVLGKEEIALKAAQSFEEGTSFGGIVAQILSDDRHALSPQRARNIVRWLKEGAPLIRRWQKIFVPNMQTSMLLTLHEGTADWIDRGFVREELIKRAALNK
jgi:hypothetical protein